MNMQSFINAMSAMWKTERQSSQMTLGKMLLRLAELPPETPVSAFDYPHSYRGYYVDLAFEAREGTIPATEAIARCKSAVGQTYGGWKGGDYTMDESSPCWFVSQEGCSGLRVMSIADSGEVELKEEEI